MKASYSAWLLEVSNPIQIDCSTATSLGPSKMIPAPLPFLLEESSTLNSQNVFSSVTGGSSVRKSVRNRAFIGPLDS